ncbi:hypothetical protein AcidC75_02400 [Acidisoma sp. C75]
MGVAAAEAADREILRRHHHGRQIIGERGIPEPDGRVHGAGGAGEEDARTGAGRISGFRRLAQPEHEVARQERTVAGQAEKEG